MRSSNKFVAKTSWSLGKRNKWVECVSGRSGAGTSTNASTSSAPCRLKRVRQEMSKAKQLASRHNIT